MSKLDVYLRSIERFGAAGAILNSGQAVTLRFPTGDRNATQVTPHDQLVMIVREIAPPNVLDQIDKQRPARFEIDSQGIRYAINVAPRPGAWQVAIEPAAASAPPPTSSSSAAAAPAAPPPARVATPRAATPPPIDAGDMMIERGQYDGGAAPVIATSSGSTLLDQLTATARAARATDLYLSAGAPAFMRVNGELTAVDRGAIEAELLSREVGVIAPAEARAAWVDHGFATFAYGDGAGRIRVTLTRDRRGPGAALRLLPAEPPELARLGLGPHVERWLGERGLIAIAGPSGAGKTTTLAALVRALGERSRSVIAIEDPIELVHASPWVSQRAIGEHVASVGAGVTAAMLEGADAIVVGTVTSSAAAAAVIDAVSGGHLVLVTLVAPVAHVALERMLDRLPVEQRELGRALCTDALLGTIAPVVGRGGARTFEITGRGTGS